MLRHADVHAIRDLEVLGMQHEQKGMKDGLQLLFEGKTSPKSANFSYNIILVKFEMFTPE